MASANRCQCCLQRSSERDMKTPYTSLGISEIYSVMLEECFLIKLRLGRDGTSGICMECVVRLREACRFKMQVEECQDTLQGMQGWRDERPGVKDEPVARVTADTSNEQEDCSVEAEVSSDEDCETVPREDCSVEAEVSSDEDCEAVPQKDCSVKSGVPSGEDCVTVPQEERAVKAGVSSGEDCVTVPRLKYLAEWGISEETIKRFEENGISLELMKCVKSEELKELLPNIRERILFRSGLEQLCKLMNNESSDTVDTDNDVKSAASSSPASRASRASTTSSLRYTENHREMDLTTILNDNNDGKLVLARLKTCTTLDSTSRARLTKSIVEWYLKHYERMKKEDFEVIADAIQRFIPTELKETYYIPSVRYQNKYKPAKGKLPDRYYNQRRVLLREGVIGLGQKRKLEFENTQEHSDVPDYDEDTVSLRPRNMGMA